ncbi:MAG5620 family putative phospho-sugar mutase [Mycoplasmopsis alligatoris]|uniref:Uncharacterized protein n=1 Tax=Mycoplasmopsis alligatoris A21JP2 TaxID=747682 RepID=D4XVM9_9BACT|nr:hypothetical protein [Mycoplasmopsis alligatoris]EFF41604.1 hypothetical protein MALL_0547 [Mycoplasmopsis alligatoris A21JP2]
MSQTKDIISKNWLNYYNDDLKTKEELSVIFNNWEIKKDAFFKLPSFYNNSLEFWKDLGLGSFNNYTLEIISSILANELGEQKNVFLAFDKEINVKLREEIIKIFNFKKHNIVTNFKVDEINEDIVRSISTSGNFIATIYFEKKPSKPNGALKMFKSNGDIINKQIFYELQNKMKDFDLEILKTLNPSYENTSLTKLVDFYANALSEKLNNYFPSYKQNLRIHGVFFNQLQNNIFSKTVKKLGFNFVNLSKKIIGSELIKGSYNFINNLKFTQKVPDIFFICNNENKVELYLKINGGLKKFGQDSISFLFIDFMFTFWKKNNMLDKTIILPLNASKRVVNIIKNYNLKFKYENEVLNEDETLYYYSNHRFSSGVFNNYNLNNTEFILLVIVMLNNYKNKNDLLNYKYNQSLEIYSSYSKQIKTIHLDASAISQFNNLFTVGQNLTKKEKIIEIKNNNFDREYIKYLQNITLSSGSSFMLYYDYKKSLLVIELEHKIDKNMINLFNLFIKKYIMFRISKAINLLKK